MDVHKYFDDGITPKNASMTAKLKVRIQINHTKPPFAVIPLQIMKRKVAATDFDAMGEEDNRLEDRGSNYVNKLKQRNRGLEIVFDPKAHKYVGLRIWAILFQYYHIIYKLHTF